MFENKVKIVMVKGEKGDAGTTGDYSGLENKPKINGIELVGNKTSSELGFMTLTDAEMQRDAIAQFESDVQDEITDFETEVQANISDIETDIDDYKDDVNEILDGMQSDLDILGARTQTQDITDNIFVSGSRSARVVSISMKASKTGNVVSLTSIWYLNASNVTADCQIYRQYAPKKSMTFPIINGDTNDCIGWAFFDGTDDVTNDEVTISLQFASAYASQSMSVFIDATYVCDDIETYYASNPDAVIIQDGSVTTSKLADGAVTFDKINSQTRKLIPNFDYEILSSGSYNLNSSAFSGCGNWRFIGVTVSNAPAGCNGGYFTLTSYEAEEQQDSQAGICICQEILVDGKQYKRIITGAGISQWWLVVTMGNGGVIPNPPASNGTYRLTVTVAGGVPTYGWVRQKKFSLVYDETADGTETSYEITGSYEKVVVFMQIPASASSIVFRCEADGTLLGYITSQTDAPREGSALADCSEGLLMSQFVLNANVNSVGAINAYPSHFAPKNEINTIRFVLNTGAVIPSGAIMKVYAY